MEPLTEYVFGTITDQPMRARRGSDRWLVTPGQVSAWDPRGPHACSVIDDRPSSARLMIIGNDAMAAPLVPSSSRVSIGEWIARLPRKKVLPLHPHTADTGFVVTQLGVGFHRAEARAFEGPLGCKVVKIGVSADHPLSDRRQSAREFPTLPPRSPVLARRAPARSRSQRLRHRDDL